MHFIDEKNQIKYQLMWLRAIHALRCNSFGINLSPLLQAVKDEHRSSYRAVPCSHVLQSP